MKTHQLGENGPQFSVIGFGAWAIGGPWIYGWGTVDDRESIKAIHRALDSGINWIDTAAAYGFGHSEEVVGKAIMGIRNEVFVATKCGQISDGKGGVVLTSHPKSLRKEVEESLRRLQVDCIDLYQIHWPDKNTPVEESWAEMVLFQEEGKVKYIGVSNYDVSLLERIQKIAPVQSLQPPYSMVNRDVEKEILPFCLKQGIGVVAYSPMQSGLLTGRFDVKKLADDDWRQKAYWFQEPFLSKALDFVEKLRPIAKKHGKTVGQLAVAWVLKHPAMTAAIVGARTDSQVAENVGAAEFELTDEEMEKIRGSIEERFGR